MGIVNTKEPYNSTRLEQDLVALSKRYHLQINRIGYSHLCKPIYEIQLGNGPKKVHLNASFHANEWITSLVLMKWLEQFLDGYFPKVNLTECTISIVPMVNPDGVDLVTGHPIPKAWQDYCQIINHGSNDFSDWKANIRGVDLNNQYPSNWAIEKARKKPKNYAPRDFPGIAPLTEPEAIAMARLVEVKKFDRVFAFHTQGKEIYWGYENCHPYEESKRIVDELAKSSGYKAVEIIDSHAGFKDWFIYICKKPGFTIELGYGVNPLPLEQFDEIYENTHDMIAGAIYL